MVMKSLFLAVLAIGFTAWMPLALAAEEGRVPCRFVSEDAPREVAGRDHGFSAGLAALSRGDTAAAQVHFDRALVEQANPMIFWFVGEFYRTGDCLPKDLGKAAAVYRMGADRGDGGALLALALLTWNGQGVPKDKDTAIQLFRQGLIAFDLLGGQADIPELEGLVDGPVPPELLDEFDWVEKLATTPGMGLAVADALLARPSPDGVAACRYMALSFDSHPDAETAYRLGMMHLEEREIALSKFYGFLYLSRAATEKHPGATAEIGRRQMRGEIPSRHDWDTLAWLIRAKRLGAPVGNEVEAVKKLLSPSLIREAEMQAHFRPLLDLPTSNGIGSCTAKGKNSGNGL